MTVLLEPRGDTRLRDPREILDRIGEAHPALTPDPGVGLWEREVRLLQRDVVRVRSLAERILGQGIAYLVTAMEKPGNDMGPGFEVDQGVHQVILDTPVYFALCAAYNGGRYKHHAPLIQRRRDGIVLRTADLIAANGFAVDWELWEVDASDCGPCDDKVPDSH
ncbi:MULTISPECIES: hypothetical protein [Streptomyces]|uniref:Uncharacterized protein n=1 Tax=Streptomyces evansiae TaxID=3075535 RepID=A0ABU2R117_9ACTN|nr:MULTISPECIES: hypothetical protein [unclassified Streptomyces]MDT0410387.1 hypothetical protein [Streptomyces sp. DSM 41979]MDT0420752.1 hypothetical protein [Streptomyces sp. DSM 41859]MYQ57075.1 hypothetical protein [Streptomyces sp. SID4926]NJA58004.1 hypothetical protein [Streptomyces sp. NEAU-H3]WEH27615.1 hypothetical protein P0D76_09915 [Streptomyces sp. AM 3-1-1]